MFSVNLNWRLHKVSDGERRRVQIVLGLINPFKVLLLDEVSILLFYFLNIMFICGIL